jgi:hypothetical protein
VGVRKGARRREVVGGPYDGLQATARPGAHAFIDAGGRCWNWPGPGRFLYRFVDRRTDGKRWEFAGYGARRCGVCGAVVWPDGDGRPPACFCGG